MKKIVSVLLACLMVLACVSALAEETTTLNFWGWGFEWEDYTDNFSANYPEEPIAFNHVTYDSGAIQVPLDNTLKEGAGSDEYPDLFCAEASFVRKYVESDYTMDLGELFGGTDQLMAALQESGVDMYLVGIGTDSEGRVKGLCFQNVANVLFYRRSAALEYLGTDDPTEVYEKYCKDPETFIQTCLMVAEKSEGKVAGISSLEEVNQGYRMELEDYAIVDDYFTPQKAMLDYLYSMKLLWDGKALNNTARFTESWYQDVQNISESPAMFYPGSPWKMGVLMSANIGETAGDWAVTVSPYQTTEGGTWLCVGKDTQHPEEVKRFLEYWALDTSEKGQFQLVADNGDCPASAVVIKRIGDVGYAYDVCGGQNTLAVYSEAASKMGMDIPAVKYYDEITNNIWSNCAAAANAWIQGEVEDFAECVEYLCTDVEDVYQCEIPDSDEIAEIAAAYLAEREA